MADPVPSPSFIPKQNPNKFARRAVSRQVYVFTLVSYTLCIATLLAVAGVYLYGRYTTQTLVATITKYENLTASFDEAAMEEVIEVDERLRHASDLIDRTVSISAALAILEAATVDTVQFTDLSFTQESKTELVLEASVVTDSFDSVLFQRNIYEADKEITAVTLDEVSVKFSSPDIEGGEAGGKTAVSFSARFSINPNTVPILKATSTVATSSVPTTGPTSLVPVTVPIASSTMSSAASSTASTTRP